MVADYTGVVALSATNILLGIVTLGMVIALTVAIVRDVLDHRRSRRHEPTRSGPA